MTSGALCAMLEKHYRGRRRRGQIGQRNNNHYFVASEHGSEAAPQRGRGEQSVQGFGKAALLPIFSGLSERNKITEVLLRWPGSAAGAGLPVSTENLVSKKHVSEQGKNFSQFTKAGLSPRRKSGGRGAGVAVYIPPICSAKTRQQMQGPRHKKSPVFRPSFFCRSWTPLRAAPRETGAIRASPNQNSTPTRESQARRATFPRGGSRPGEARSLQP